ncbi:MAG: hypothetical protein ACO1QB_12270 [Verrucomicrobiales bacterium]
MKDLTRWSSKLGKSLLVGILFLSGVNMEAGLLSILKNGKPDDQPAPPPAKAATSEWQRVAFVGSAKVKQITGTAEMLTGVDRWTPLRKDQTLNPGDMVRTDKGSRVILKMTASGSLIAITPKTILRLTQLEEGEDKGILSGAEEAAGYSVRSLRGAAEYRVKSKKWKAITVNTVVPVGARVRTQSDSTMDLFHKGSGSFLRMNPDAELTLDPTATYPAKLVAVQTEPTLRGTKTAQVSK